MMHRWKTLRLVHAVQPALYELTRRVYLVLKARCVPFLRNYPRLHRWAKECKTGVEQRLRPAERVPPFMDTTNDMPAVNSSCRVSDLTDSGPAIGATGLPEWLVLEWRAIHLIEPMLFPRTEAPVEMVTDYIARSRVGENYLDLCGEFGPDANHVFLVPWLKKGGADLVTLNYIKALSDSGMAKGIVVISTENEDSPWKKRLPESVRLVEFGRRFGRLREGEQERLLVRVLLQKAPTAIHLVNSLLGYGCFIKYGHGLAEYSRLYACAFCEDVTPEGRLNGYPICFLPDCFDSLTAVFSDNQRMLDKLAQTFAFEEDKLLVHYQPVNLSGPVPQRPDPEDKEVLDILWAGRLDVQKRPDLLVKVAEACQDLPFRFHVYGTPVYGTSSRQAKAYVSSLNSLENVTYYGPFDGFSSLPVERFDLFLYTSQWDGLPNTILEAMYLGLPVVASDVGGIAEAVHHGETGFLVTPFDNVQGFVENLERFVSERSLLQEMSANCRGLIDTRHSWEGFVDRIKQAPGYVRS